MSVPKLRFGEFSGDWDRSTMNNIGTFSKGSVLAKCDLSENGKPCILYGELYTKYKEIADVIFSKTQNDDSKLTYSKGKDVLIPASGETAIDIATATCVIKEGVVLGGDLNIFNSNKVDGRIISYILNSKNKLEIAKLAQGKSVVHISGNALKNVFIGYPKPSQSKKKLLISYLPLMKRLKTNKGL